MLFKRGKAISGAPINKVRTNSQSHQLRQHYKEKDHNKACAVTMYYIIDN